MNRYRQYPVRTRRTRLNSIMRLASASSRRATKFTSLLHAPALSMLMDYSAMSYAHICIKADH